MSTTNAALDQAFKPEAYGSLVDSVIESSATAFNKSVASVLRIPGESVRIPLLTADVSAGWYSELDSLVESDPTTDELVVTPKKVSSYTLASNESVMDTSPAIANLIGNSAGRAVAKKIDDALFSLTAITKGPQLTLGTVAYSSVDVAPETMTFDDLHTGIKIAKDEGANPTAIVINPAIELQIRNTKGGTGLNTYLVNDQLLADEQRRSGYAGFSVGGVPVYVSRSVDAATGAWILDAAQVFTVQRMGTTVVADKSAAFQQDGTAIRTVARVDFGITNPAGVVRVYDSV